MRPEQSDKAEIWKNGRPAILMAACGQQTRPDNGERRSGRFLGLTPTTHTVSTFIADSGLARHRKKIEFSLTKTHWTQGNFNCIQRKVLSALCLPEEGHLLLPGTGLDCDRKLPASLPCEATLADSLSLTCSPYFSRPTTSRVRLMPRFIIAIPFRILCVYCPGPLLAPLLLLQRQSAS